MLRIVAPSTAAPSLPFTFSVTALDPYGNVATGFGGTIRFSSSDSKASLPGYAILTSGMGTLTAAFSANTKNSYQTLAAIDIVSRNISGSVTIFVDQPTKVHRHSHSHSHAVHPVTLHAHGRVPCGAVGLALRPHRQRLSL
jgi:hypothetical protein